MASPFALISTQIAAAFKDQLAKGRIFRQTSDSLDERGDPEISGSALYPAQGIISFWTEGWHQAGIPITDVKIMLINKLTSCPKPIVKSDRIFIGPIDNSVPFKWYQIREIVDQDPAGATTTLQAYECKDPTTES